MSHNGSGQDERVKRQLSDWFLTKLNLEIPSADTDLFETGVLDSLGFVELMLHLEQEFGIKVALDQVEIDHFRSIERMVAFVLTGSGAEDRRRPPAFRRRRSAGR
jgi:D-alanine--poly(phosphoribitol) ligase subunit 2